MEKIKNKIEKVDDKPNRVIAVVTKVKTFVRNRWQGSVVKITIFGLELNFPNTRDEEKVCYENNERCSCGNSK